MTGTADISNAQLNAINELAAEAVIRLNGAGLGRVVIHPADAKAVRVVFHVVGYGTTWAEINREGNVTTALQIG